MTAHLQRPDAALPPREGSLRAGVAFNAVALGTQGAIRLAFTVVAARLLGPSDYGDLAAALAVSMLVAVVWPASGGAALVKYVRLSWGAHDGAAAGSAVSHLCKRLIQYLAVVTPVLLIGGFAATGSGGFAWGLLLLSWGYSLQLFGRGVHVSTGKLVREFAVQVLSGTAALAALVGADLAGSRDMHPGTVALIYGGAMTLAGLLTWPRSVRWRDPRPRPAGVDSFVFLAAAGSLASAGFLQLLVVASRLRLDSHSAGLQSAAASLASPLTLAGAALSMALYPRIAHLMGAREIAGIRRLRLALFRQMLVASLPAMGVFLVVASAAVPVLFGTDFAEASGPLAVLVLAVVVTTFAVPSVAVLTAGTNYAVSRMSAAAWVGMLAGGLTWLYPGATLVSMTCGYTLGMWVTASLAIHGADRVSRVRLLPAWLGTSAGLALVTGAFVVVDHEGWSPLVFAALVVATCIWLATCFLVGRTHWIARDQEAVPVLSWRC